MDGQIRVAKVERVWVEIGAHSDSNNSSGSGSNGSSNSSSNRASSQTAHLVTLYLFTHHLLIRFQTGHELWIPVSMLYEVKKKKNPKLVPMDPTQSLHYPLFLYTRNFLHCRLYLPTETSCLDVYLSLQSLTHIKSIEKLYAFQFKPIIPYNTDGWQLYKAQEELGRFCGSNAGMQERAWRLSEANKDYKLSETYPSTLGVPRDISDAVLYHASKFRSRARFPALTFVHPRSFGSITRSSQPLVGLQSKRSPQDERLVQAIFQGGTIVSNLIIDARPLKNAMVTQAMGAGTESMENYKNCQRPFMGIENIHVMRDSLNKLTDSIYRMDQGIDKWYHWLDSSSWLKHIKTIMESANTIIAAVESGGNALIHCSDGWDRTAQLSSLASLCMDPAYRTLKGFQTIIEKEWLSFGHKFSERCGHLQKHSQNSDNPSSKDEKETAPVFQQFLEATRNVILQYPHEFEFNERLLIDLHDATYSCQFGTFLLCNERERIVHHVAQHTQSFWSYVNENLNNYLSPLYLPSRSTLWISTGAKDVQYWSSFYDRFQDDVFGGSLLDEPSPVNNSPYLISNPYWRRCAKGIAEAVDSLHRRREYLNHSTALLQHHIAMTDRRIDKLKEKFSEANKPLPDIASINSTATRSLSLDLKTLRPQRQSACSISNTLFFQSDPQFTCMWCGKVVCAASSRHQLSLVDVVGAAVMLERGDEAENVLELAKQKYRACDACIKRVKRL